MPVIKDIGYMWHRKYIDWEGKRELIGYPEIGKGGGVNFANQAAIYALYDRNFQCIYVGQVGKGETVGLFDRLRDHTHDDLFCMWERFSWFGFYSANSIDKETYNDEFDITTNVNELMNVIESLIIRICRLPFKKAVGCLFNEKSNEDIAWYYQKAEWEVQKDQFNKLKRICKSLGNKKS
jgi:hypothetical protein